MWVVTFVATVAGSVDTFDQAAYKTNLAAYLDGNVTASEISLTVTAASVKVLSEIRAPSASASAGLVNKIATGSIAGLTSALGVEVLSKQAPQVQQKMLGPAEEPTTSLAPGILALIIILPVAALLVIAAVVMVRRRKSAKPKTMTKDSKAEGNPEAQAEAQADGL